jgi:hypothetical protein
MIANFAGDAASKNGRTERKERDVTIHSHEQSEQSLFSSLHILLKQFSADTGTGAQQPSNMSAISNLFIHFPFFLK